MKKSNACSTSLLLFFLLCSCVVHADSKLDELTQLYIEKWIDFYPSDAFTNGHKSSAWFFEDFTETRIADWLKLNHQSLKTLAALETESSSNQDIDARVIRRKIKQELELWQYDKVLVNQPIWYAELISQAMTYVLVREEFTRTEKMRATTVRLKGVQSLSGLGVKMLSNGSKERTARAINILERTASFYDNSLIELSRDWANADEHEKLAQLARDTAGSIRQLASHVQNNILPVASIPDHFDNADYARKLQIDVDSDITPGQLKEKALQEIDKVRGMMVIESKAWWQQRHPQSTLPENEPELLTAAMTAMEADRDDNRTDFLQFFTKYTQEAEQFLIDHEIATVPLPHTLLVDLSPDHFSGAAYGGVYPTGPFNPDANTLFYLPSIPDDSPDEQKTGFYKSFNKHFNTMIIAHEMYPGHYLQYKIAVSAAPAIRTLFANGVYAEGWGTFSEELMLDAGWGKGQKLTRLAHLRKRLENATRAYLSVMVHHEGWEKDQVMDFATRRGLLAPQFALNLWNRVMNSPLQITNYFLGFHGFKTLWQHEQLRLGDKFTIRNFVDGVLRAGPIPIDAIGATLQ
ncbi:MAG: hypothetical protein ACI909_001881 [Planctomycetota bacterium]